ncbi:hypothetical protein FKM82_016322 [Ascaphus truei]
MVHGNTNQVIPRSLSAPFNLPFCNSWREFTFCSVILNQELDFSVTTIFFWVSHRGFLENETGFALLNLAEVRRWPTSVLKGR